MECLSAILKGNSIAFYNIWQAILDHLSSVLVDSLTVKFLPLT